MENIGSGGRREWSLARTSAGVGGASRRGSHHKVVARTGASKLLQRRGGVRHMPTSAVHIAAGEIVTHLADISDTITSIRIESPCSFLLLGPIASLVYR